MKYFGELKAAAKCLMVHRLPGGMKSILDILPQKCVDIKAHSGEGHEKFSCIQGGWA